MTTSTRTPIATLAALALATTLAACGGGDSPIVNGVAANSAGSGGTTTNGGGAGSTVAGCTGPVAAFFALAKGSYSATAATFDNVNFASTPATVAGFANGAAQTVTVNENCTVTIGALTLSYKDGSYAEFPGTGADAGKTQYDVDLTGTGTTGLALPHFERWTSDKRGLSLFDPTHTSQGVRFDEV